MTTKTESLSIAEAIKRFLRSLEAKNRAELTIITYGRDLGAFAQWLTENNLLATTVDQVERSFASARGASGPRPRGAPGRGVRPTSGRRASARGRASRSPRTKPGCGAGRCGTSGTAWRAHAGRSRCARRTGHPAAAAARRSRGPRLRPRSTTLSAGAGVGTHGS